MDKMILSIIITSHNNENTIESCINSFYSYVANNKLVEIICVDDHSTDNTVNIIQKYEKLISIHSFGKGVSQNRNTGIRNSNGKFIWFVDADDELNGAFIKRLLHTLKIGNADLYLIGMKKVSKGHYIALKNNLQTVCNVYLEPRKAAKLIETNSISSPCNKIYRRSIIQKYGLVFEEASSGEDVLFNCEYFKKCKIVESIPYLLYIYYIYSPTSSKWKWKPDELRISLIMLERLTNFPSENGLISSTMINKLAIDSVIGNEINIVNERENFTFCMYKEKFYSLEMKKLRKYTCLEGKNFRYYFKFFISNSLLLSYVYSKLLSKNKE